MQCFRSPGCCRITHQYPALNLYRWYNSCFTVCLEAFVSIQNPYCKLHVWFVVSSVVQVQQHQQSFRACEQLRMNAIDFVFFSLIHPVPVSPSVVLPLPVQHWLWCGLRVQKR